mgnify:FL=1
MKLLKPFTEADSPRWLLSFDFDGTLVDPDEDPAVSADFFELMKEMRSAHKSCWGINTGRSLMQAVQGLIDARFPILPDYIIAREREIYLPNKFGRWVGNEDWNKRCEREHHKLFRQCRKVLKGLKQWVEDETAAVWGIQKEEPAGIVASTASEMDMIVRKIDGEIESKTSLSYQRNGIYLRFSHKHFHKGTAMLEVARLMGLSKQHAFAVGDSHNDLDMLDPEMAEMLACPANACPEVKLQVARVGGYVATRKASRGVVDALRAHFADKK